MAKKYKVKLLRKEKIAKDTWLFAFQKPEGYLFTPGQYQTFTLTLSNGKTDWRDMTITSSPQHHELWLVTKVPKQPSKFKQTLSSLQIGVEVVLVGPSGGFTVRDEKPHVFLAGGIGVNVFHSILVDAAEKRLQISMTMIASFSTKEDMIFLGELKKVENEKRNIIFIDKRISKDILQNHTSLEKIFMIAGPQEFVDAMQEMLTEMGVKSENIRIDYFTGY